MNSIRQQSNNYKGNSTYGVRFDNNNRNRGTNNNEFINKFRNLDMGPAIHVMPLGYVSYTCEQEIICKATIENSVPYFNTPIYLKNKQQIGKVNEIFGNIKDYFVSVTLSSDLMKAESFNINEELFIDSTKLLSIDRFLPKCNVNKKRNLNMINKHNVNKKNDFSKAVRFNVAKDYNRRPGIMRNNNYQRQSGSGGGGGSSRGYATGFYKRKY